MLTNVCVFCGSSPGALEAYRTAADELGRQLGKSRRRLIYGGGNVGLMGVLANAAMAEGGEVIGVIPDHLVSREVSHPSLTELKIVESMHERKQIMSDLADCFILLPGGLGSLEEFFEVWTWGQLGLHEKPYGVLNVAGYFNALLAFVDHAVGERFLRPEHRSLLLTDDSVPDLLERLDQHVVPTLPKWIDRDVT